MCTAQQASKHGRPVRVLLPGCCVVYKHACWCVLTFAVIAVSQLTIAGAVVSLLFRFESELRTLVPDDFELVVLAPQVSTCLTPGWAPCYTTSCPALVPPVALRQAMLISLMQQALVLLWIEYSVVRL